MRDKKRREKELAKNHFAISDAVEDLMQSKVPITSTKIIKDKMIEMHRLAISEPTIRKYIKTDLDLRFKRYKKLPIQCNSDRCLVLRQ